MPSVRRILVFRFSAMGDVAMTAPVLREFKEKYPETELIVVSRALFAPFYEGISGIKFHPIEPKGKHQGLFGLYTLFKELKAYQPDALADLHYNLRSRILTTFFRLSGISVAHLDKARSEKNELIRQKNKVLRPLKHMTERYADVFRELGFVFQLKNKLLKQPEKLEEQILSVIGPKNEKKWIGISPFAQHAQKVYPLDKMEQVLVQLADAGYQLFIFGGGTGEQQIAEKWTKLSSNIISIIGKLKLKEELALISNLDLMLSMDSAGMHMASLKGIPVLSIWGATHPFTGFLGYGQNLNNCVQVDLSCRPCSVYGNKICYRGDFACMHQLSIETILKKIADNIS
ncbi:MAG: hypothetical protein RI924_1113 [Bacteroidota bacterium]|jgi:ADP-heptose:LPS heptosyltransferase